MATPIRKTTTQPGKAVVAPGLTLGKPIQEIVWTALPNGVRKETRSGGKSYLRLSVFVAPRLCIRNTPIEPHLASFPDFMDWPARAKAIEFDVQFGSKPKVRAAKTGIEPDS
jgi:hypothetical protein